MLADNDSDEEPEPAAPSRPEEPSTSSTFARKSTIEEAWDVIKKSVYDEAKKTCILCKRAFSDVEILRKHVEKSELHRVSGKFELL